MGLTPALVVLTALVIGLLITGGIWLVLAGASPVHPPRTRGSRAPKLRRRTVIALAIGAAGGAVATMLTGWVIWLVIAPVAAVLLPQLLATGVDSEIELLAALDRWTRFLAASLRTGKSVTDAVRLSVQSAPAILAEPLLTLSMRLDERWTPREGFRALADDLNSPTADAAIAALILAAERGGTGICASLDELSEVLQRRLVALREIVAERAKPRIVIRQVSIVMAVVVTVAVLFGRGFFAPYGSGIGQVVLAGLIAAYLGSLAMVRALSTPRRRSRILAGWT